MTRASRYVNISRMPQRVYPNLAAFFRANPEQTAAAIADELGVSAPFISMIKWRERQPKLELALKIAERCHVPLESLIRKAS